MPCFLGCCRRSNVIAFNLSRLVSAWQLVVKRALAHWRLLSSVVIGVLMASTIMGGTFIYFDALRELALKSSLGRLTTKDADIVVKAERGPTNYDEFARVEQVIDQNVDALVSSYLRGQITAFKTSTFFLTLAGEETFAGTDNSRTYFGVLEGIENHITLLAGGRMPGDQRLNAPGEPPIIEAIVPAESAEAYGVGVGDQLSAVPFWTSDTPYARVVITGLFRPTNPDDEIWHLDETVLQAATGPSFRTVPFHVTEAAFMNVLGAEFKDMDSSYAWLLQVDKGSINANNAEGALLDVRTLQRRLVQRLNGFRQNTELDEALEEHNRRLLFSKVPMFVVLVLIAVVILYYVVTLSSMLVEEQRGEIALLRSRGADRTQILTVFVLEGATLAIAATIIGPIFASIVVSLLGYTPAFSDLSEGARLPVSISREAYLMSGVGGLLSFAALMIPAFQATRISVTRHRQESARPATVPVFQRYYLDILLLVVGILLFRQLTEQGSIFATEIFGEVVVNQLLLAVPAVVLLGAAMVLLRLFPLVMTVSSRLMSNWLPAGLMLGIWQMARNPTHYARLSLLLILTAGLGIFVASFGGTLQRNFSERVLYSTGSDIRIQGVSVNRTGPTRPFAESYESIDGVTGAVPTYRGSGHDLTSLFGVTYDMFAVDPQGIADIAWFRDDFAGKPVQELLDQLPHDNSPEGLALPEGSRSLFVMVRPDRSYGQAWIYARVRDANGRHFGYPLGTLDVNDWTVMQADLSGRNRFGFISRLRPVQPLTLVSIYIDQTTVDRPLPTGSLLFDYIRVVTSDGTSVTLDDFDGTSAWHAFHATPDATADEVRYSQASFNGGGDSLVFSWSEGDTFGNRGFYAGEELTPIPVLASKLFLNQTDHEIGSVLTVSVRGRRVDVEIVDKVNFFPTLNTLTKRWLIADLDSVSRQANLSGSFGEIYPNEAWLTTAVQGGDRELLREQLRGEPFEGSQIHDLEQNMAQSQADPLVEAGWRALLFMAFAAVLILSCMGFLVHAYVSFRSRALQFALLRTVGLSGRQLLSLVWLEQILVIVAGLALGSWMGGRLGETVMPFLGHDDQGAQVLPPFQLDINWTTLLSTYAAMGLVFAIIIFGVILFVRRISLQRVLRLGEM